MTGHRGVLQKTSKKLLHHSTEKTYVFEIDPKTLSLVQYPKASLDEVTESTKRKKEISLVGATVEAIESESTEEFPFEIRDLKGKTTRLFAKSDPDRYEWIQELKTVIPGGRHPSTQRVSFARDGELEQMETATDEDKRRASFHMERMRSLTALHSPELDIYGGDMDVGEDAMFMLRPKEVKLRDKWIFTIGVMNLCITMFLVGANHGALLWYYTFKAPLLIGHRIVTFWQNQWQYYCLEFCYFGNLLLILTIWVFYDDERFFPVAFSVCTGPLAWAVVLFRNSLVFHDISMTTSTFIHLTPNAVVWVIRWWNPFENMKVCDDCNNWLYSLAFPTAYFACHQVFYFIVVQVLLRKKIENSPVARTTYKDFFAHDKRDGLLFSIINVFGPKLRVIMFGFVYTLGSAISSAIMMLPSLLWYKSFEAHTAFLVFCLFVVVYNGANFYIEVFSRRYQGNLQKNPFNK